MTTVFHDSDSLILRDVPVSSAIIELTDHSLALIDTGAPGNPSFISQIHDLGYRCDDFAIIFTTHLHLDHIGGNRLFPNARILISNRELQHEILLNRALRESDDPVAGLCSMGRNFDENMRKLAQDLKTLAEWCPVDELVGNPDQIEFYEDQPRLPGGFSILKVPGHSIDHRAIQVQGQFRQLLVTGDAIYHRELWREPPIRCLHYNETLFRHSAERILSFPSIIIPGHDRPFDNRTGEYLPYGTISI